MSVLVSVVVSQGVERGVVGVSHGSVSVEVEDVSSHGSVSMEVEVDVSSHGSVSIDVDGIQPSYGSVSMEELSVGEL